MADVTMPQLGETVTEGTITRWFKQVGDQVEEDESLFEVSTDKVDSEVPASTSGYLTEILVKEGETVDVGAKLAVISDAPGGAGDSNGQGAAAAEAPAPAPEPEPEPDPEPPAPEPVAEVASAPRPRPQPAPAPTAAPARSDGPRRVLSPVVRRLIAEHDLDPDQIAGTGYQNRITRDDVLAHLDKGASGPRPAAAPASTAAPSARPAATISTAGGADDQVIPFSNIRRRTAEHMVRSLETSAHVLTVIEVDFDNVDRVRNAAKGRWKDDEGFSLTYLPFVSRAVIDAIRDFPHVNASVDGDSLVVHRFVNLGFAVDLSFEGLIVPVIHDADAKRMRSLARELTDLASRARSKKLNADEISGATFTLTNPGGYGTLLTFPVINQPNVAIVSTDGVRKKPVVVTLPDGTDAIAIHPVGNLALSFDHRAFDGAYASAFIARVRDILETRDWSQEL